MNEFKGTPGPWKADYWLDGEPSIMFDGPALTRVCRMEHIVKAGAAPNDEMEANADLIASAPALLKALADLLEAYESVMHSEFDYPGDPWSAEGRYDVEAIAAHAAIAKALGK